MNTQTIGTLTFGMLAALAVLGLADALITIFKMLRHDPQAGEWFGSHVFLLRMLPRPNAIFLLVALLSLVDFLYTQWEPLVWLGGACLLAAIVYGELHGVVGMMANREHAADSLPAQGSALSSPPAAPAPYQATGASSAAPQVPAAPAPAGKRPRSDSEVRLIGLTFLGGSLLGAYIGIWLPLSEALKGAPSIHYYDEACMLIPVTTVIGLLCVIFGAKGYAVLQTKPKTGVMLLFIALAAAYAFGVMALAAYVMGLLGYA